jgi:ADP-ribose pyrophosphatase YjhB (NUDIX family)
LSRTDYYRDPAAPAPNALVVGASAIVTDDGRILLHRRVDNDFWALPGGNTELGESITTTVIREVREETGLDVEPLYVVGVYSDPEHVFAYDDGEVRQEFSVCVACRLLGGVLRISEESRELGYFSPTDLDGLHMHPRIRVRIDDYLAGERGALR